MQPRSVTPPGVALVISIAAMGMSAIASGASRATGIGHSSADDVIESNRSAAGTGWFFR